MNKRLSYIIKTLLIPCLLLVAVFLLSRNTAISQILNPVRWSFSVERISNDEAILIFQAKIDASWHLYGMAIQEGGPVPTSFVFEPDKATYQLAGKISEPKGKTVFDPNFEMHLKLFDNEAIFKQKIKILSTEAFVIEGRVEFMCCDDSNCLPPAEKGFIFSIDLKEFQMSGK